MITATKVMLAGLKANQEALAQWGVNEAFLTQYEEVYNDAMRLDNEQEALKAQLKEKTAATEGKVAAMEKFHSNAKKIVKMQMPKESWKAFGINDVK